MTTFRKRFLCPSPNRFRNKMTKSSTAGTKRFTYQSFRRSRFLSSVALQRDRHEYDRKALAYKFPYLALYELGDGSEEAFDNAMKELRRRITEGDRMEISDTLGSEKITQVYSRITDRFTAN